MKHGLDDSDSRGGWSDPGPEPTPATEQASPDPVAAGARYELGARLGEGGMGVVVAARDRVLGRDLALKALRADQESSATARARLVREAALTSRLDHAGIMTVHDAGTLPDGRAFYTMRLVRGRSLAEAIAAAPDAPARRRLVRVVLAAAEAVAAAHDMGIVHRDLKPSNILLGPRGETQVADWGLAVPTAAAAPRWRELPPLSATGSVGTPGFSAPEQQAGAAPDPRHDVYSLGRTLAAVLGDGAPAELQAIVSRATDPAPARRYPAADALADDLLAWFEGRRVEAHHYSPAELLRRTLRAWRAPLLAALVGTLGIAVAVLGGWWETTRSLGRALQAEAAAAEALAALRVEEATRAALAGARGEAEALAMEVLAHGEDPVARGVLAAFGRAERPTLVRDLPAPTCSWTALSADGSWMLCGDGTQLHRLDGGRERWSVPLPAEAGTASAETVRAWTGAGQLWALDPESGAVQAHWPTVLGDWTTHHGSGAIWVHGGPMHLRPALPSGCEGTLVVADVHADGRVAALCESGRLVVASADGAAVHALQTEATGDHVASALRWFDENTVIIGTIRGRLQLVHTGTGALLRQTSTALGSIALLEPDAQRQLVAVSGAHGGVLLWRPDAGAVVAEVPAARPRSVALSPAGLVVADGRVRTWTLPEAAPAVLSSDTGFSQLAVSPEGGALVAVGGGGRVLRMDLHTGRVERRRFGDRVVKAALVDGKELVVAGMGGPLAGRAQPDGWAPLPGARPLRRLGRLAGGDLLGLDMNDGLYRWASAQSAPEHRLAGRRFVDLATWGELALLLDTSGGLTRLQGEAQEQLEVVPGARAVALGHQCLAVATLEAVQLDCGQGRRSLSAGGDRLLDVALSADEEHVAAGTLEGRIRVWSRRDGQLIGVLPGHTERVVAVAFLPDGDLASASWDHSVRLWDLDALTRPLAELRASQQPALDPAPAPDRR